MSNFPRLLRTLAHLKPVQITNRITSRFSRPVSMVAPSLAARAPRRKWVACQGRPASMISPNRFTFHGNEGEVLDAEGWNSNSRPKLWLYHLHYFDDLLAMRASVRARWHEDLIAQWIGQNPPLHGNGWEPYPLSRRIGNWVSWALAGGKLNDQARESLALQARVLTNSLEYHLLGNHLFANAKALVFAGSYFEGSEADAWRNLGLKILFRELNEQILPDGGHFELSPMYHAITLEDMIDLYQLSQVFPDILLQAAKDQDWTGHIEKMVEWLNVMTHPDGEISYFNDASLDQARKPKGLIAYAAQFNLAGSTYPSNLKHLTSSGYLRIDQGQFALLFDVGQIGPRYLAGHAHADTLSFELSVGGQRLITNSGASTYAISSQRDFERSTAAHATVELEGEDSSEMWASFRVGRRARPIKVDTGKNGRSLIAEAAHDGYRYLKGRPKVHRRIEATEKYICLYDSVETVSSHLAVGRLPLHPSIKIAETTVSGWRLLMPSGELVTIEVSGPCQLATEQGTFASSFGVIAPRSVLKWSGELGNGVVIQTEISV